METKREKAKWTKACKKLQANDSSSSESEGEQFEDHLAVKSVKETVREEDPAVFNLESSSSSSSSDSDSEQDTGCRENYVSERTTKNKNKIAQKKCETSSPHYKQS
jgi:hypothetical protein